MELDSILDKHSINKDYFLKIVGVENEDYFKVIVRDSRLYKENFIDRVKHAISYIFTGKRPATEFNIVKSDIPSLISMITYINRKNPRVMHALNEIEIANSVKDSNHNINPSMAKDLIELISVFCSYTNKYRNDDPYIIALFSKIARYDIISPLTFKADEFVKDSFSTKSNVLVNIRNRSIHKDIYGIYNANAFGLKVIQSKYLGSNEIVKIPDIGMSVGIVFEMRRNVATGRAFRRCYFSDNDVAKGRFVERKIRIPATQVEVTKDYWLYFVSGNNELLNTLDHHYKINWFTVNQIKGKHITEITQSYGY